MIQYIPFEDLTPEHLECIAASLLAAPAWHRPEGADILRSIKNEVSRVFEVDECLLVLSTPESDGIKRLRIDAFSGKAFRRGKLVDFLRRLAADWECDAIETFTFDPRLACAIEKVGGRVEAWSLVVDLKG